MLQSLLLSALAAGTPLPFPAPTSDLREPKEVREALATFRAEHGAGWRFLPDPGTGRLRLISGGRGRPLFRPSRDEDYVELGRRELDRTLALHGIGRDTLVLDRALFLPLGQIGAEDKVTVRFRQAVRGVPVVGGFVNVLFSTDGSLLSIQSTGLPGLSGFPTAPAASGRQAADLARRSFAARSAPPTRIGEPVLVVDAHEGPDGTRSPRLSWQVDVAREDPGAIPEGTRFFLDARDGSVLRTENTVHHADVGGTVTSMATTGLDPDSATNPPAPLPMRYLVVQSAAGTTTTDANGQFVFPGATGPLDCTFIYAGPLAAVGNAAGSDYTVTQTLATGTGNQVLMNPAGAPEYTAQANASLGVARQRDWVRALNPAEDHMEFQRLAIVNWPNACDAYFDGGEIVFFAAGSGCPNMAYTTVVSHEDGHWANVMFGTGNGPDGMGEGNADTWAEYVHDTPIVGAGFYGPNTILRDGRNTRPFCGDCCGGCYGEVHADGEVWMGAAWKMRAHLVADFGNAAGGLAANLLFLSWMEAYDQVAIQSVIETQWLTLDDTNGNIDDGTPHYAEIDQGFLDQSFPGVVLKPLSFGAVTEVADTPVQLEKETVDAVIHANVAPLASAVLRYRVNGGAFVDLSLSPTGNDTYEAVLPGQFAPAHVEYYVAATDTAANVATYPEFAPDTLLDYDVGEAHVILADNFDHGGENGWTHGSYGDTSNPADAWIHRVPRGNSGVAGGTAWTDPPSAASGPLCIGTALGYGGDHGAYPPDAHMWLRSPVIDASGATGTHLRFRRWSSFEGSASDRARILVNGTPVFENPPTPLVDRSWTTQDLDLSALADGQPSVQVEFELESDGQNEFGGWQIDDVEILWLGVAPCPTPSNVCFQTTNSADPIGASMAWSGTPIVSRNDLVLASTSCPPRRKGLFMFSRGQAEIPYGDGYLCLAAPVHRLRTLTTDASGGATFPLDLANLPSGVSIEAGETWYFQLLFRDPLAGGSGFNTSDALRVTFCP